MKQKQNKKKTIAWLVGLVVAFAYIMSIGPGIYLVNQPKIFIWLPRVYVWAILWYLVISAAAIAAYIWVWEDDSHASESQEDQTP